ncbi:transposase [Streptomyces sp. NPDC059697]|uniref:transposase n=1 Tax=Streptomyces sp. NPDC059697 TaxID=3346912 RepID=UPI0036B25CE3
MPLAARILGHIGDIDRFPTEHHFASYVGAAPLDASSGKNIRHRLNTGGNRALNSAGRLQVPGSCGWSGCDRLGRMTGQARAS